MREKARVVSVSGKLVTVTPLDSTACASCDAAGCGNAGKAGRAFVAVNRAGLALEAGDSVLVRVSGRRQFVEGLISLGVPAAAAIASYFAIPFAVRGAGEGARVGIALAAFGAFSFAVFLFARRYERGLPEIVALA